MSTSGDKLEKGDEFILKDNNLYCNADFTDSDIADPKYNSKSESFLLYR